MKQTKIIKMNRCCFGKLIKNEHIYFVEEIKIDRLFVEENQNENQNEYVFFIVIK